MSRYNVAKKKVTARSTRLRATRTTGKRKPNAVNRAGGKAFTTTEEYELASAICTSFTEDKAYETNTGRQERIRALIAKMPLFAAKCAVFARQILGLRSISHSVLAEIAAVVKGQSWTKPAIIAGIRRPDDMTEILAYYMAEYGKPIPNSLRKALKEAFGKFNTYQLAKYRGEGNAVSLVDAVNIVHPRPTSRNQEALAALIAGELKNEETWESLLSAAGSDAGKKASVWMNLLLENKLPYFALLKNLRNIAEQAPTALPLALEKLVDEKAIKRSLVLPFRFATAYSQIEAASTLSYSQRSSILQAISQAVDVSTVSNLDRLPGNTLVVLDTSGSMNTMHVSAPGQKPNPERTAAKIGSLFAAALLKANPTADFMTFSSYAKYQSVARNQPVMTLNKTISGMIDGGGTVMGDVFTKATKAYDNIIILTDNESWKGSQPNTQLEVYKKRFSANPKIFSFDLAGYGTLQFPQENLFVLFGFSDRVLSLINFLITDKEALLTAIKNVDFADNAVPEEDSAESDT